MVCLNETVVDDEASLPGSGVASRPEGVMPGGQGGLSLVTLPEPWLATQAEPASTTLPLGESTTPSGAPAGRV